MRRADLALADMDTDAIFDVGLHEFLTRFMERNAGIAHAIAEDYRFHA